MFPLLAETPSWTPSLQTVMSGVSLAITAYFWLVKARRERPCLQVHQITNFRSSLRSVAGEKEIKRLCLSQIDSGGVLIANHSTRQNSVLRFDCQLAAPTGWLSGTWGYTGDDKPPWNIGPETTLAFSPACFFDVPADFELPDDLRFRIELITVSGKRFAADLAMQAPVT